MPRQSFGRPVAFLLALFLLASPATGGGALTDTPAGDAPTVSSGADERLVFLAQEHANNSTTRHENPAEVSEEGDLDGLESYLSQRLLESLGRSTVEISQGEYERGRTLLGDDYSKIQAATGWEPTVDFEEGVVRVCEPYKDAPLAK